MPSNNSTVSDTGIASPSNTSGGNAMVEVANKIFEAKNVLVALSSDPSVDEMAAAIGLTLYLDRLGKRATAIYSGSTPNALEFLEPEKTFESSADTLQDFVIALNKDKADHLRYKLDGEYVKIYITPYKARIDSRDLEFTYGDYNVDLVLALDVTNGADLDSALREHGRIMHDAVVVNITTGNPGKFGEIEWNDKRASSISEMIAKLLYSMGGEAQIEKGDATAFLTGIVAATNRFSNAKTTPDTMQIASRLMESGANQQLISKNITPEVENELYKTKKEATETTSEDSTKLSITHGTTGGDWNNEEVKAMSADAGGVDVNTTTEPKEEVAREVRSDEVASASTVEPELMAVDDLKKAAADLTQAGSEVVPEVVDQPVKIESDNTTTAVVESELKANFGDAAAEAMPDSSTISASMDGASISEPQGSPALPPVMAPSDGANLGIIGSNGSVDGVQLSPIGQDNAVGDGNGMMDSMQQPTTEKIVPAMPDVAPFEAATGGANPASMMAPQVTGEPEASNVPDMNYMPLPGQEILPPPPTPPIAVDSLDAQMESVGAPMASVATGTNDAAGNGEFGSMPTAATSGDTSTSGAEAQPMSLGPQPAMQDQVYTPQAVDPGAFKIPGM